MGKRPNVASTGSESQEQQALIQWWALAHKAYNLPEFLLFAIPNGGSRSAITGARLKAEGVRAGIPDLFLACPRGGKAGLFIELKRSKAPGVRTRVTAEQSKAFEMLAGRGYSCHVAYGFKEAREEIDKYLSCVAATEGV